MDSNPKYRHSNVTIFPNIHLTKVPLGLTHTLVQLPPPFGGSRRGRAGWRSQPAGRRWLGCQPASQPAGGWQTG